MHNIWWCLHAARRSVTGAAGAVFRRVLQVGGAVCVASDGVSLRRAGRRRGLQAAACGWPAECRDGGVPVAAIPVRHRLLASRRSAAWPSGAQVGGRTAGAYLAGRLQRRRRRLWDGGVADRQCGVGFVGSGGGFTGEAMPRRRRWFRGGDLNSSWDVWPRLIAVSFLVVGNAGGAVVLAKPDRMF
jgi:hypothetical protein